LITSGAVALVLEEFQQQGLKIVVSNAATNSPVPVKTIRVNPAYKSAADRATRVKKQLAAADSDPASKVDSKDESVVPPSVELARAYSDQARFDLGVLDIATGERLKNPLTMDDANLPEVTAAQFVMVGYPFPASEYRGTAPTPSDAPQERTSPPDGALRSESNLTLSMEFPADVANDNWSGSPVLDRNKRVIGVYSRATMSEKGARPGSAGRHSIVWLGRLREFAPDVE
jgi:hypothetical protein